MVDVDGYGASQEQHISRYHVNIQFNKNTTTSYALQCERDGGMISQGIGRGVIQTPETQGEARCQWENP